MFQLAVQHIDDGPSWTRTQIPDFGTGGLDHRATPAAAAASILLLQHDFLLSSLFSESRSMDHGGSTQPEEDHFVPGNIMKNINQTPNIILISKFSTFGLLPIYFSVEKWRKPPDD